MPIPQPTDYDGFLVVVGDWRISYVRKPRTRSYQLGLYAGPDTTEYDRLFALKHARRAMLTAGHSVVV